MVRLILKCHGTTRQNGFEQLRLEIAKDHRIKVIARDLDLTSPRLWRLGELAIATNFSFYEC
jgi:hypothetical protein